MEKKATEILLRLGFSQEMIDGTMSNLSGGWKSRCRLAIALIVPSDVLLLDEPSNFLVS
jgi:ATPase subunit of ABC transporter with duplicated ATPase domains